MENKSVAVTLEHVTKVFKNVKGKADVVAVNDSNFVIEPGELVTLLGPSGCGKTTTLRMVAGFELPSEGKIYIGNEDVTMLPPNKRNTATMFQSYGLFPHMTVYDNVAYGLRLRKTDEKEIRERVETMLSLLGLEGYGERAPSKLSGGQQQRVALARTLIVAPQVLLFDEPLSNLDALLREQMRVEIKKIQKQFGITAIYVTHDRTEAMSLSDRVIVMKDGYVRQIGRPYEIYEEPNSRFVAGFVGKAAFFPVKVISEKDGKFVTVLDGKNVDVHSAAEDVKAGSDAVIMARPESLRVVEKGKGKFDAKVKLNVYLGNSVESFLETTFGEVLVEIDDPRTKRVFSEGECVSVDFDPERVRLLGVSED